MKHNPLLRTQFSPQNVKTEKRNANSIDQGKAAHHEPPYLVLYSCFVFFLFLILNMIQMKLRQNLFFFNFEADVSFAVFNKNSEMVSFFLKRAV